MARSVPDRAARYRARAASAAASDAAHAATSTTSAWRGKTFSSRTRWTSSSASAQASGSTVRPKSRSAAWRSVDRTTPLVAMPHNARCSMPARAQHDVEVAARERADAALDGDDLARRRRERGMDRGRVVVLRHRAGGAQRAERAVARADLGVAGAERDAHVDHGHAGVAGRGDRAGGGLEHGVAEALDDAVLHVHDEQRADGAVGHGGAASVGGATGADGRGDVAAMRAGDAAPRARSSAGAIPDATGSTASPSIAAASSPSSWW